MKHIVYYVQHFFDKRFSTIAGTLVYFLLMSIAPLILLLTLFFGEIDTDIFLSLEFFNGIAPFVNYLKEEAIHAANGVGIILFLTSLYSSTNFFYHLRRSGEIIYGTDKSINGIKLRLVSLVMIITVAFLLLALITAIFFGQKILINLPNYLSKIIIIFTLTISALFLSLILNAFCCPKSVKPKTLLAGCCFTTALWILSVIGFNIYLNFASPERLYGRITTVFVFLLWCYVMMCCLVVGVIYNSLTFTNKKIKKLPLSKK